MFQELRITDSPEIYFRAVAVLDYLTNCGPRKDQLTLLWQKGNADRVGCRSPPHWRPLPRRHGRRPALPREGGRPEGGRCRSLIPRPAGEVQSGHGRENRGTS